MTNNFLQLNDDKTELLILGSKKQVSKVSMPGVRVGDSLISPVSKVRNLGAIFDGEMSMVPHVNAVCASARHHIRNIGRIRRFLDRSTCEKIIHAYVTSRLDINNALLSGLPKDKLQLCQNVAAQVITLTHITDHISPILRQLHWLPVAQRIEFKVLIHVYRAVHGTAPSYICELVQQHEPGRALRSADSQLLRVPRTRHSWGDRAFCRAGPTIWNRLPLHIRTVPSLAAFKSRLKTHLFSKFGAQ